MIKKGIFASLILGLIFFCTNLKKETGEYVTEDQ